MSSRGSALGRLSFLMATCFVDMLGFLIVLPLLPFYATRLGADAFVVGLMVSAFAVAQLATAPLWGRLSDRIGRRPTILGGLVISALAYLLFALACAERATAVLEPGGAARRALRLAPGAGGGHRHHRGGPGLRQRLGAAGGARQGARLAHRGDLGRGDDRSGDRLARRDARARRPGLVAAGLCVANVTFGFFYLPEPPRAGAERRAGDEAWPALGAPDDGRDARPPGPARPVADLDLRRRHDGVHGDERGAGALLQHRFGVTEKSIGYFYTFVGAVSLVMRSLVLGPAVARFGEPRVLQLGILALALGFALMPFAPGIPVFGLVVMLIPVGTALLFPSTTSLVSRVADRAEVGQMMGVQQAYGGVARMVGPMWAGAAFEHLSPSAPFWISAAPGRRPLALRGPPPPRARARSAEPSTASAKPTAGA